MSDKTGTGSGSLPPTSPHRVITPAPARVRSLALLQSASVVEVEHNGQIYRLQKTALNKLILTK